MSTPTCPNCGTKFPGDPCKKCDMPMGLTKGEIKQVKVSHAMEAEGVTSKRARKRLLHRKPSRATSQKAPTALYRRLRRRAVPSED